jgi:hypothetical protein
MVKILEITKSFPKRGNLFINGSTSVFMSVPVTMAEGKKRIYPKYFTVN